MVATSNRKPSELYKNGIQRSSFLPFIDDLQQRCYAHDLASGTDYRTINALDASGGTYMSPLNESVRSRAKEVCKKSALSPKALLLRCGSVLLPVEDVPAVRRGCDGLSSLRRDAPPVLSDTSGALRHLRCFQGFETPR